MDEIVKIGSKKIGPEQPCYIIAEAGVNHDGDVEVGHKLIEAAKEAGADAVKFQMFKAGDLVTEQTPKADYQIETTSGGSQIKMLESLELEDAEHMELLRHCQEVGIEYMCTPYEIGSAEKLNNMGVTSFKIASTDTTNTPFLAAISRFNKPLILSTGMCSLAEVDVAVSSIRSSAPETPLVILHCVAEYPAPFDELNLRVMDTFSLAFQCPIGFSDHSAGRGASPWAVAMGARVVEKHFTLDRQRSGPDHRASIEPEELSELVTEIRNLESAMGTSEKRVTPSEQKNKMLMQKSLVAKTAIAKGNPIKLEFLTCKRPATGIPPNQLERVLGNRARKDIQEGELIMFDMIDWT